jgi:hypothetical protein
MSDRQLILDTLNRLPHELTLEEAIEELSILAAIRKAERELDAGQGIPHEDVTRRIAEWSSR